MNFKRPMSQPLGTICKMVCVWMHFPRRKFKTFTVFPIQSRTQKIFFFKQPRHRWDYILPSLYSGPSFLSLPSAPKNSAQYMTGYPTDPILFSGPFLVFPPMEMQSECFFFYSSVFKPGTCESSISTVPGPRLSHYCPSQPCALIEHTGAPFYLLIPENQHLFALAWRAHLRRRKCPGVQSSTPGPSV